jgi:N-acetylglutamate synthase-like GNAT family acetyltransferase
MIRLANWEDRGDIVALDELCFPDDDRVDLDNTLWWIALVDETQVVGFGGLRVLEHDVGYLCRAGVADSLRGQGIHDALIRARLAYAKMIGLQQVITYTLTDNPFSANNLADEGFRLYLPEYPWAGRSALYWARGLG